MALQLGAMLAAPSVALAQNPAIDTLFPAKPTGYVTDAAGLLDPAARDQLESLARRLEAATGAQMAVVTLPTIGERDEGEVALAIGRRWGVGEKAAVGDPRRNAGLVLLVVPRQNHQPGTGHIRIESGQGLEGIVTDALAGRVRRDVMGPYLAQEQYGPALEAGTRALATTIARGYGVTDTTLTSYALPRQPSGGRRPVGISWWPLALFVFFLIVSSRSRRGQRRGVYWGGGGPWIGGGGWGGGGGGGFGGFGGGGGFSGGGSGGRF
jgi:uncharacterized protein